MTQEETEAGIYEDAVKAAQQFAEAHPGLAEAVHGQVVYIGRIALLFEQALRDLIPLAYDPEEFVPVLEGTVVEEDPS